MHPKTRVMKRIFIPLILLFIISMPVTFGQTDVNISKKDFKSGKQGFSDAWDHVKKGDSFFSEGGGIYYGKAFNEYIQAIVYNNSNAELNYKTGVSALLSDKKEEAAAFLTKAIGLKADVSEDILLFTARSMQYEERFSEALQMFNDYLGSPVRKSKADTAFANSCIRECNSALMVMQDTLKVAIVNLGNEINSQFDDYSQNFTADGNTLYFASKRNEEENDGNDENVFISSLNLGSWSRAENAGKALNSDFSETPVFINKGSDTLYVYAGYEGDGDIKISVSRKGSWQEPVSLPFPINGAGAQTSMCFAPSGNEIYFVSEAGRINEGGKDIYIIRKIRGRKWSKPVNAGTQINTPYDEESVRFSATGDTLWFSSQGHNSTGGFDIFFSVRNAAGEWDSVKNAGYPLNTPWDEIFFSPSLSDDSLFYFVSNRKGGFGRMDIYSARLEPEIDSADINIIAPPERPLISSDTLQIGELPILPAVMPDAGSVVQKESSAEPGQKEVETPAIKPDMNLNY